MLISLRQGHGAVLGRGERTLRRLVVANTYISDPKDFEYSGDYSSAYRPVLKEIEQEAEEQGANIS